MEFNVCRQCNEIHGKKNWAVNILSFSFFIVELWTVFSSDFFFLNCVNFLNIFPTLTYTNHSNFFLWLRHDWVSFSFSLGLFFDSEYFWIGKKISTKTTQSCVQWMNFYFQHIIFNLISWKNISCWFLTIIFIIHLHHKQSIEAFEGQ